MGQLPQTGIKTDIQVTVNSTIKNNNQQNGNIENNNNEPEFKKEATETIIVAEMKNSVDLIKTPRKTENNEIITRLTDKKEKTATNLKSACGIKLLTLFEKDKTPNSKVNINDLEIKINNYGLNENRTNKKIRLSSNQETFFQSVDIDSILPINNNIEDTKIKINSIDLTNSQKKKYQKNNQIVEEDEKENNYNETDINAAQTKRILVNKLHSDE